MRYCHLTLVCNTASVKSTAFQNCTGKKKHTLALWLIAAKIIEIQAVVHEILSLKVCV